MTEDEARNRLQIAGASPVNAAQVAATLAENEAEGNTICGWYYLTVFEEQLRTRRIDGHATPKLDSDASVVRVDAANGFAQPAIGLGIPKLIEAAKSNGVGVLAVRRSYNALALGPWVRCLAKANLIGLAFANAPASVAPPGAKGPIYGTNPFAVAVPVEGTEPIVLDQSTSAVTKTEVLIRAEENRPLEAGWAQDSSGRPTLDANLATEGALLPAGGRKGAGFALLVEILAAVATGGTLSAYAAPLGDAAAKHPELGQLFIALDSKRLGGGDGLSLVNVLDRFEAHVPGRGRARERTSDA